jgi:hypothetical protein
MGLAQLLLVAAALLVLFMEPVVPVALRLVVHLTALVAADLVPVGLEVTPLVGTNREPAAAGLIFPGGKPKPVLAAAVVVELWGPVKEVINVELLGVLDMLKLQPLLVHRLL